MSSTVEKTVEKPLQNVADQGGDVAVAKQFLTFHLAGEEYGVEILKVREIKGWSSVTRIPNSPSYVKGMMNLRGAIVPITDMRLRLGLESAPYTKTTVVVVVLIEISGKSRTVGMIVDGVSDVLTALSADIKSPPEFGGDVQAEHIKGLVDNEKGMVMLLDIDGLMGVEELLAMDAA